MTPLLWTSSRRYALRHPWLLWLSVLGVALGVAVVVAIDLANSSARQAFALSAETVTGRATHQVVGGTDALDEAVYRDLRLQAGFRDAAPVVDAYATAPGHGGRTFQVLGVDPLAEAPFRSYVGRDTALDLGAFMATPGTGVLAAPTAEALGLALGDTLTLRFSGLDRTMTLVGLITPDDPRSARALANLVIADIATVQRWADQPGRLTRIDLLLPDGPAGEAARARIAAVLPEGTEVVRAATRSDTIAQMTRAFELNLSALSLLALIVGMFLIYNTMTFSVVQRRPLIGRLRALGVTRNEVFTLVLGEAAVIGLVGTVLGVLLGIVLGRGLVQLVTQTINDLYYVITVRELAVAPMTLAKGVGLGLGTTLLAALAPAREATTAPASTVLQRSSMETQQRAQVPRLAWTGVGMGVLGGVLLLVPGGQIVVSYAALFALLMAFALLTPAAVIGFARLIRPLAGRLFGVLGRMAASGIEAALSRTAVAVAALMIALAATVGVGVMVDSFRQTVETWLTYSLQADIFVQPPHMVARMGSASIQPAMAERLATTPGVTGMYSVRQREVGTSAGRSMLTVIARGPRTHQAFRFKAGDAEAIWADFDDPETALISEPYSYRQGLDVGDVVTLQTDRGPRTFTIRGVFFDYANDLGTVLISRTVYERFFDDRGFSGIALYTEAGADLDVVMERLQARVGGEQALFIRSNRDLLAFSLDIFDRTFTITSVLRLLAVLVAFIGVLSALMALQLERVREFAVLRAIGLTPLQVWGYVTTQTGLMGIVAGLLAVPLGLVLAFVLIFVINKRSFGWTLQLQVAPEVLLLAFGLAVLAAVLAGLYPSWKMARANPALALRAD